MPWRDEEPVQQHPDGRWCGIGIDHLLNCRPAVDIQFDDATPAIGWQNTRKTSNRLASSVCPAPPAECSVPGPRIAKTTADPATRQDAVALMFASASVAPVGLIEVAPTSIPPPTADVAKPACPPAPPSACPRRPQHHKREENEAQVSRNVDWPAPRHVALPPDRRDTRLSTALLLELLLRCPENAGQPGHLLLRQDARDRSLHPVVNKHTFGDMHRRAPLP